MTHTKGPWTIEHSGTNRTLIYGNRGIDPVTEARAAIVADLGSPGGPNPLWNYIEHDEHTANARLLAVAPALLAAAQEAAGWLDEYFITAYGPDEGSTSLLKQLRAAIEAAS